MGRLKERRRRTLAKTISWRLIASLMTVLVVFALTREILISLSISFFDIITKTIAYYAHERAWNKFGWGIRELWKTKK